MTQNKPKPTKIQASLSAFSKQVTYEARAQLAEYIIAQKLLEQIIDEVESEGAPDSVSDKESFQEASKFFRGLLPKASPLALITAFRDPAATTELLDPTAIQKFSDSIPDLCALCQTPEAQALTPAEIFDELYHGESELVSSIVSDFFREFAEYQDPERSSSDDNSSSSGLVN